MKIATNSLRNTVCKSGIIKYFDGMKPGEYDELKTNSTNTSL